eukprot:CAMPEP_0170093736 /NCGR_PEP_ID=MMETSP0019_2-20121128/26716_1 /TAXON_ID=98059 /ORGANISM="Dinobryon sp., Strain UTEXLB2267" /LENGTH=80 /DNA_ID=CAMNT_0010314689 /DNA_START=383 /DNA_END=621 /DNA_ORIENTATION=+
MPLLKSVVIDPIVYAVQEFATVASVERQVVDEAATKMVGKFTHLKGEVNARLMFVPVLLSSLVSICKGEALLKNSENIVG